MLTSATIDGLKALRLHAMAAALAEQNEQPGYAGLGFDERLGLLVDRELTARASRRMDRCLKAARLRSPAAVEDIDFRHPRGLDRAQILGLAPASGRDPFQNLPAARCVLLQLGGVVGADVAGGDAVDVDALARPLVGQRLGQLSHTAL